MDHAEPDGPIRSFFTEIGDNAIWIIVIYGAVLIPLTFLYTHDFFSSKWNQLREIHFWGRFHFIITILLTPLILLYMISQLILDDRDWKEMLAASAALTLSIFHLLRSFYGLNQLHAFREWAIRTGLAMERLTFELPEPPRDAYDRKLYERTRGTCLSKFLDCCIPCFRLRTGRKKDVLAIENKIDRMYVNNTVIDNELFNGMAPSVTTRTRRPNEPHRLYIQWAVCFLAQFGGKWLAECDLDTMDGHTWDQQRNKLASEIWATAALRMGDDDQHALLSIPHLHDVTTPSERKGGETAAPAYAFEIFSKDDMLRKCLANAAYFPLGTGIPEHESKTWHAINDRSKMEDARKDLPSRLKHKLKHMKTGHLEWFIVFLWISGKLFGSSAPRRLVECKQRLEEHGPEDTPVMVLRAQLGFRDRLTLDKCAFPISRFFGYGRTLWGNPNVLEASARIDNWLALSIGKQIEQEDAPDIDKFDQDKIEGAFGLHLELEWDRLKRQLNWTDPQYNHHEQGITFMGCVMEMLRQRIAAQSVEYIDQHLWETTSWDKHPVIINISSQLGDYLRQAKEPGEDDRLVEVNKNNCSTHFSKLFSSCFKSKDKPEVPQDVLPEVDNNTSTLFKERLLWECQVGVVEALDNNIISKEDDPSIAVQELPEAMMLMMLSVPGIKIEETERAPPSFKITPVCVMPQKFCMGVNYMEDADQTAHQLQIRILRHGHSLQDLGKGNEDKSAGTEPFKWMEWRDSFEGRLRGKMKWQQEHYMPCLPIERTRKRIFNMSETNAWVGWEPFRIYLATSQTETFSAYKKIPSSGLHDDQISAQTSIDFNHNRDDDDQDIDSGDNALDQMTRQFSDPLQARDGLFPNQARSGSIALDHILNLGLPFTSRPVVQQEKPLLNNAGDLSVKTRMLFRKTPKEVALEEYSSSADSEKRKKGEKLVLDEIFHAVRSKNVTTETLYNVGKWMILGEHGVTKNVNEGLHFLERAVTNRGDLPGLNASVAAIKLFVITAIDESKIVSACTSNKKLKNNASMHGYIKKAKFLLEKLWEEFHQNVRRGFMTETEFEHLVRGLVDINIQMIKAERSAEFMRTLAIHLEKLGPPMSSDVQYREKAIRLYESAIIAGCDVIAMTRLALLSAAEDPSFATKLYKRACDEKRADTKRFDPKSHIRQYITDLKKSSDDDSKSRARVLEAWFLNSNEAKAAGQTAVSTVISIDEISKRLA